jgi:lipopolysaccharide biosynthesis glycosyltransferase
MANTIPIVYCFDANYAPYAAISTYSLIKNSITSLKIYWIALRKDVDEIPHIIHHFNQKKISIQIIIANEGYFEDWKVNSPTKGHIEKSTYLRLLIPNLIKEDKCIYLDSDTLVLSDLNGLFEINMQASSIAGVIDPGGGTSKLPRVNADPYINAGVLLMDLKKLREDNFLQKSFDIQVKYNDLLTWNDQCIINKYAESNKKVVDFKWNAQIFTNLIKDAAWNNVISKKDTNVLHFVGPIKPWHEWCNPAISAYWWEYANEFNLPKLMLSKISSFDQAIALSSVLDLNEKYKESSLMKSKIINQLLGRIKN